MGSGVPRVSRRQFPRRCNDLVSRIGREGPPAAFAAVAGFYLLSRSMAAMQIIAGAPLQDPTLTDRVVNAVVELIALLLPALDRMTQTTWLLESAPGMSTLVSIVGQTTLYLVLICSAALFDLYRKNF